MQGSFVYRAQITSQVLFFASYRLRSTLTGQIPPPGNISLIQYLGSYLARLDGNIEPSYSRLTANSSQFIYDASVGLPDDPKIHVR